MRISDTLASSELSLVHKRMWKNRVQKREVHVSHDIYLGLA
jgi:hypothetical protein